MRTDLEATNKIRERTLAEGFDIVGFADADLGSENGERLSSFIENESTTKRAGSKTKTESLSTQPLKSLTVTK